MNEIKLAKKYISKEQSAIARNIEFSISFTSYKNLMRAKKCYYTGICLTEPTGPAQLTTDRTIDRIDPTKGYVHGNVVACCFQANQIKSQMEQYPKITKKIFRKSKIFA